jgi:hypothetical protein
MPDDLIPQARVTITKHCDGQAYRNGVHRQTALALGIRYRINRRPSDLAKRRLLHRSINSSRTDLGEQIRINLPNT